MSDSGQVSVSVNNVSGHDAELLLGLDERGHVVFQGPPPGNFDVDPDGQMTELLNVLQLLRQAGLRAAERAAKRGGAGST